MEIHLTAEQQAQLSQIAAVEGKRLDDVASAVFSRGLADEARFAAAVRVGQHAAKQGFVESAAVWAGVEQILQS